MLKLKKKMKKVLVKVEKKKLKKVKVKFQNSLRVWTFFSKFQSGETSVSWQKAKVKVVAILEILFLPKCSRNCKNLENIF